jgi:hypothetical protein
MPPQIKRTDAGTGAIIDQDFLGEEIDTNFLGDEIPRDQWRQDDNGNIIIDPAPVENFLGPELTASGDLKYEDGVFTFEGFKEWEAKEREEGRDGFWHWLTVTLPEGSKDAFSYLYEGGKELPEKFKEDPLKAAAIFPEAALSAAEGYKDIATGAIDLVQRPFRSEQENERARYERYKLFADRSKRILEDRKSRVGDAIRAAGYLLDSDLEDYASAYDEGINPASADTLGIVFDPAALFGGSLYRTAGRVVGKPAVAANKALNNAIKGVNQGTLKKVFDVAKETAKRPATQFTKGVGKTVDLTGKGIEFVGQKIVDAGQQGRMLQSFPQLAKGVGETVKLKGGAIGTPGQILSVASEAAQKAGRRQTGLGLVKKRGTLRAPIQKAVQILDTPLSDRLLRNAGDLADKITKGTAIGIGTGYVAGGAEGAAAGGGFGAFGGGVGFGAEKAAKYTPLVRNKFKGMERLKLDEEFITDYAARLPEAERKGFLNPDRRMSVSDLAAEADAAQLFQGYLRKEGANVGIKYVDGEGMVKALSKDPENPDVNARYQYGAYDPNSNTIFINTDSSGTGRNRTLFHELFHPTEYFSAPREKASGRDKGEQVDPFGDTRAELEQTLFGTFDGAGNQITKGMYNKKQMLDFEGQYLDAKFQLNPNSPLGRKIAEARKLRDQAIKDNDTEAIDKITFLLGQYELQKRQNRKAKENYLKGDVATRRKNITSEILSEHFANFGEEAHFGLLRKAKDVLQRDRFSKNNLSNKLAKLSLSTLGGMRRMLEGKGVTFDAAGNPKGDFKAESGIFVDPLTGENLITTPEVEHLLAQYVVSLDKFNNRLIIDKTGFDTVETASSLKDTKRSELTPEREKQLREIGWLEDFDAEDNPIFSTARNRNKKHREEVAKVIDILNANPDDTGEPKMWRKTKTKAGRDRWEAGVPSEKQMQALRNSDLDPSYVEKIDKIRNAILKGDGTIWGNDYYKAITGGKYDSRAKVKFSLIVPFALEATQAGNINIKAFNLSKLEQKIGNYADQRPAFFDAWNGDTDAFRRDIVDFFQGPNRGKLFPEGDRKDLIYQFLRIENKQNPLSGEWVDNSRLIESNRIERSTNLEPYENLDKIPFDYGKALRREYMPEPNQQQGARFMPPPAPTTPQFKRFFEGSKVVDDKGDPLVVYSGHGNTELYGTKYDKNRGTSGGFYATEDPVVASSYAKGKIGGREFYEDGSEYRFKYKNGNWGKKIWQIELTPEQQAKAKQFLKEEAGFDIDKYWQENARYDRDANRARLTGGVRRLSNIHKFMESMGDTIKYADETDKPVSEMTPYEVIENQGVSRFEDLLNEIGIEWNAFDKRQPGVFPLYLSIKNPIDASKPFPQDVLTALKKSASRERPKFEGEYWTKDLSMKEFVNEIEKGSEYWSTQVPTKAKKIFQEFGYDGIKELGNKKGDGERQVNWIAFEPEQIKSVLNRGEFSPENPDIRFMPQPTFYSKAERAVEGAKAGIFNKEGMTSVGQAKALLEKNAPETELEWSGVLDYLDLQKEEGNKVSKQDLLNYLKNNGVEVEEVYRSGSDTDTLREKYADQMLQRYEIDTDPDDPLAVNGYVAIDENGEMLRGFGGDVVRLEGSVLDAEAGLRDILFDESLNMPQDELRQIVEGGDTPVAGPTLFSPTEQFAGGPASLPGGENYSELVLKLPDSKLPKDSFDVPSGHRFPEENILAHIRFTERTDADGKRMLFLDEVQSDWNSEGRERGFYKKRPERVQEEIDRLNLDIADIRNKRAQFYGEDYIKYRDLTEEAFDSKLDRMQELLEEYPDERRGVPDMPYKGSKWQDLVMKRMIRWAADNGYDRLGWITGKDTADRYDLSKVINEIAIPTVNENSRAIRLETGKGDSFKMMVDNEGKVDGAFKASQFNGKQLDEVIGKELAEKVMAFESPGSLTGTDLKVGGEWASNLYDKSLPKIARKLTKKKGAVGRVGIYGSNGKLNSALAKNGIKPKYEANYVDISPEVKELAQEGFSYFMPEGRGGAASAPVQTAAPQPPSGVIIPKVKLTEDEKEESRKLLQQLLDR